MLNNGCGRLALTLDTAASRNAGSPAHLAGSGLSSTDYPTALAAALYPCTVRTPASSSECSAFSLSLTSALVLPLTFFRTRFPAALKPSETTPRQRPSQVR